MANSRAHKEEMGAMAKGYDFIKSDAQGNSKMGKAITGAVLGAGASLIKKLGGAMKSNREANEIYKDTDKALANAPWEKN